MKSIDESLTMGDTMNWNGGISKRASRIAKRITANYDLGRRAVRELGIGSCRLSRMQKTPWWENILETRRLQGSTQALTDLGRFLEENGYDGPSSCTVEVVRDQLEYQEPVDGVSYGLHGDGIVITMNNGSQWKWGILA